MAESNLYPDNFVKKYLKKKISEITNEEVGPDVSVVFSSSNFGILS